jgi:hypothetical protein
MLTENNQQQLHPRDFTNWTSWPCVREALMLGIGGGAAAGAVRFLGTGRAYKSENNGKRDSDSCLQV